MALNVRKEVVAYGGWESSTGEPQERWLGDLSGSCNSDCWACNKKNTIRQGVFDI
ncbi:hypothetical protein ACF0H5_013753 [Mactra antiquata]